MLEWRLPGNLSLSVEQLGSYGAALLGHFRGEGVGLCFRTTEDGSNEIDDELPRCFVVVGDNNLHVADPGRPITHAETFTDLKPRIIRLCDVLRGRPMPEDGNG
jgi:hypothetical protein